MLTVPSGTNPSWWLTPLVILLAALTLGLGYGVTQSDFPRILGLYLPFFLLYGYLLRRDDYTPRQLRLLLGLGIGLRVLLLFSAPALSDDVYRFIWDGRLLVRGLNPFDHLPGYYLEPGNAVPGLTEELFQQLNSPRYFTIYPPVAQASFALAAALFPGSITGSTLVLKLFLFACEVGSIALLPALLRQFGRPGRHALIYALNPLVIVEITGNLHYEGAMIFFLLLSLWLLTRNHWWMSAGAMALSVASKLLPLMFLPFLIRRLGWRRGLGYFTISGAALALLFLPLLNDVFFAHFGSSLDLYFRKFEFNASFYYLARWVGYQQVGYNLIARIGPWLASLTFAAIALFALYERDRTPASLPAVWLFTITLYLLFTTTVHPWYVCLPLALCGFTRFRFPVWWSALIVLTYVNYSYTPYRENLWVVALEYSVVLALMGWELMRAPLAMAPCRG